MISSLRTVRTLDPSLPPGYLPIKRAPVLRNWRLPWTTIADQINSGHMNFGNYAYKDASGFNLDNQALVFQVQVPTDASPS